MRGKAPASGRMRAVTKGLGFPFVSHGIAVDFLPIAVAQTTQTYNRCTPDFSSTLLTPKRHWAFLGGFSAFFSALINPRLLTVLAPFCVRHVRYVQLVVDACTSEALSRGRFWCHFGAR